MSTICKLSPEVRRRRALRANLLRNPPKFRNHESVALAGRIMAELHLIHDSSRLRGDTKHMLFMRGAKQLAELPE
jgi:hypothetical protein